MKFSRWAKATLAGARSNVVAPQVEVQEPTRRESMRVLKAFSQGDRQCDCKNR